MEIEYTLQAKEDLDFWRKSGNASILNKIRKLIETITQSPYEGIGKSEALKYNLTGCWSRRINKEHRIVYLDLLSKIFLNLYIGLPIKILDK